MQPRFDIDDKRSFIRAFLSRLVAVYLFLFILPFPTGYLSFLGCLNRSYHRVFDWLISWTGRYLFHIPFSLAVSGSGSGDTTYNYVQLFISLVLALMLTVAWSVLDRKRKYYFVILYWLLVYVRFYFACTMIRYGMDKLLKAQFPFPFDSLSETFGESTPLRLMWNFMGYSTVYNLFIGGGEALAGFLVLFRKTTLAGALLGAAVLLNVAVLNFCFDVPVKLFALNLLLVSMYIIYPYQRRLANFFIRNRSVAPVAIAPRFSKRNTKAAWLALKVVLTLCIVYSIIQTMRYRHFSYGDGAFSQTPLFGIYHTETFIKNEDTLLPLLTDSAQWKILNIIYSRKATIRMMNDSLKSCRFITDTLHQTIQFSFEEDSGHKEILHYAIPDSVHLIINGKLKENSVRIVLRKQDLNQYRLINGRFHWINESPDNR